MRKINLKKATIYLAISVIMISSIPAISTYAKDKKTYGEINVGYYEMDGARITVGRYDSGKSTVPQDGAGEQGDEIFYGTMVHNPKKGAKYSLTTNSKNLKIINQKWAKDGSAGYRLQSCITVAPKTGNYKVYITEKYKGKGKKIESGTLKVSEPRVKGNISICVGPNHDGIFEEGLDTVDLLRDWYREAIFSYDIIQGKDSVLTSKTIKFGNSEDYTEEQLLVPVSEGQAKVRVRDSYGKDCGTVQINVGLKQCIGLSTNKENMPIILETGQEEGLVNNHYLSIETQDYDYDIDEISGLFSDSISASVADPSVVSIRFVNKTSSDYVIDFDDSKYRDDYLYVKGLKTGSTTIHLTLGNKSVDIPVYVE